MYLSFGKGPLISTPSFEKGGLGRISNPPACVVADRPPPPFWKRGK